MITTPKLSFGAGNAKLSSSITTFSLPAGHSCPFAKECQSCADRITGRITDGPHTKFRCFAASQECLYPSVRQSRWGNYERLKAAGTIEKMTNLIHQSLPHGVTIIRVHVSGDFFSEKYFLAWLNVAINNPRIVFYGYTKATPFLVKYKKFIPDNFRFTASKGGTCDNLIGKHKLKYAEVVFSEKEAEIKGIEIDHDDSHAIFSNHSFALLIHGTQPPGTAASKAWQALISKGIGGYNENSNSRKVNNERPVKMHVLLRNGQVYLPVVSRKVKTQAYVAA